MASKEPRLVTVSSTEEAMSHLSLKEKAQVEKAKKYEQATHIKPYNLYIGSYWNVMDKEFIEGSKITRVFHFATGRPAIQMDPFITDVFYQTVIRYRVKPLEKQFKLFQKASAEIHEALENGNTVLVHCMRGRSRSVAVVIAYFMEYHNKTYDEARNLIYNVRPIIGPHEALVDQLQKYEEYLTSNKQ